jgi:hypothetical protein
MLITTERTAIYNGISGLVTTIIELVSKDELVRRRSGQLEGPVLSVGELLRNSDQNQIVLKNRYTSEEINLSRETLTASFKDVDLETSFLVVSVNFSPDSDRTQGRTLDDLVNDMRRMGVPEDKIQEVIETEKKRKKEG